MTKYKYRILQLQKNSITIAYQVEYRLKGLLHLFDYDYLCSDITLEKAKEKIKIHKEQNAPYIKKIVHKE